MKLQPPMRLVSKREIIGCMPNPRCGIVGIFVFGTITVAAVDSNESNFLNMTSTTLVQLIERWPLDRLVPLANNARTHSDAQIGQIAASIAEFGFVNPIVVGTDGVIIAEHARALAAPP